MSDQSGNSKPGYQQMPIREDRIPQVNALMAQLDREEEEAESEAVEILSVEHVVDETLVRRMFEESETKHRKLLKALADRPEQWVYTKELAEAMGIKSGSKGMAGTFGAFGRRAKHRYNGAKPWQSNWDLGRGEARYLMKDDVASWTRRIAAAIGMEG